MVDTLSAQEHRVLELATEGHTDNGIAHKLGISPTTVVTYWGRIRAKLGQHSRPELVAAFACRKANQELEVLNAKIQEQASLETELLHDVERLVTLLSYAPEAIIIVSPDGVIQSGNHQAAEVLGCEVSDFPGLRVGRFIPPAIHDEHKKFREEYMKSPTRLAVGHGAGVEIVNFRGERLFGVVSLNLAKTSLGEQIVVVIRPIVPPPVQIL